jgi:hypothetical protein
MVEYRRFGRWDYVYDKKRKADVRLLLHIGQPKAGSTALQSFLAKNRRVLSQHGVVYPTVRFGGIEHGPLSSIVFERARWPRQIRHRDRIPWRQPQAEGRQLLRELARISCRPDIHTVVLSTEYLFRQLSEENAKVLREDVAAHFSDVLAVAYIREPADRYLSLCLQSVRHSGSIPNPGSGHFRKVLESWQTTVPLTVRAYDRDLLSGGNIVLDFIETFLSGIPRDQLDCHPSRTNSALSPEVCAILQQYRREIYPGQDDVIRSDGIRLADTLTRIAKQEGCLNRAYLYPCIQEYIHSKLVDELVWLQQTHGIHFAKVGQQVHGRGKPPRVRNIEDICFVDDAVQARITMLAWRDYLRPSSFPGLGRLKRGIRRIRSWLPR